MKPIECPRCNHAWYEDLGTPDTECPECGKYFTIPDFCDPIDEEDDDWENPWNG